MCYYIRQRRSGVVLPDAWQVRQFALAACLAYTLDRGEPYELVDAGGNLVDHPNANRLQVDTTSGAISVPARLVMIHTQR